MDSDFSEGCARAHELMGFLYDELNEVETHAFRGHLKECATCSAELSSFQNIRESVGVWRNEAFSSLSSPDRVNVPVPARSAVVALREFFNLSPAWMKTAVGFASLLFCVFAVLAVFGLRQSTEPVIVTVEKPASADQIDMLVKQRLEDELKRLKDQSEITATTISQPQSVTQKGVRRTNRATIGHQSNPRRPLTRVEREQLAADLRLTSSSDDSGLALLGDTINQ
ncbi:MAG TPA: hypothetical protein VIT88_04525 [Pyrinomonadaceae bacterium]